MVHSDDLFHFIQEKQSTNQEPSTIVFYFTCMYLLNINKLLSVVHVSVQKTIDWQHFFLLWEISVSFIPNDLDDWNDNQIPFKK